MFLEDIACQLPFEDKLADGILGGIGGVAVATLFQHADYELA